MTIHNFPSVVAPAVAVAHCAPCTVANHDAQTAADCQWDRERDILRLYVQEARCVGEQSASGVTVFREVKTNKAIGFSVLGFSQCLNRSVVLRNGQSLQAFDVSELVDQILHPALSLQHSQLQELRPLVRNPVFANRVINLAVAPS